MISKIYRWGLPVALRTLSGGAVSGCNGAKAAFRYGTTENVHLPEPPFPDGANVTGSYTIPQPYVCVYEEARLLGSTDPLAVTRGGRPIQEVARGLPFDVLQQIRTAGAERGWLNTGKELVLPGSSGRSGDGRLGHVVPFTRRAPQINYYHWLTEQIPRLRGVEAYASATGETPEVLVESDPPSWVTELLDLGGVPADRRREWTRSGATVDRLVVPKYVRKASPGEYEPSRADLNWVREKFRRAVSGRTAGAGPRLFVTRADADERRLENREAIGEMLHQYGFESVVPTEYSVSEQVRLFRDAEVVVGPHGAGLTNILFADDVTVVEIFPADYTPAYFYVIAELFDYDYHHLIGTDVNTYFRVDIGQLESTIKELQ
jgi:hypothetical protein